MYYFYVLYSLKDNRLYKGYTSNLEQWISRHNGGGVKSTKHRRPFVMIYSEKYVSKQEALQREKWSKTLEGGSTLIQLLIDRNILNEGKGSFGKSVGFQIPTKGRPYGPLATIRPVIKRSWVFFV